MTYNKSQFPDCYEITENEIVDSIMNLQDQIDCLLQNWKRAKDYHYKSQLANEIAHMCEVQGELKKWILSEKIKYKHRPTESEEIYINYV